MKKALKITGFALLFLLVAAILIPILFKSKILAMAKTQINSNIEAKVDFKDLSLSLFKHFPKLSMELEEVSVVGVQSFSKDTLLSAKSVDVALNLWSVIKGKDIKIHGVYLNTPRIHALVNKEGKANWEITKADTALATTAEPSSFHVALEKYAIEDGYVYYNDQSSDMSAEIAGLNHEGRGNFTQDLFTLTTTTKATAANFTYAKIPYLVNAQTGINADFEIDNGKSRYGFKKAAIKVNDLDLVADGFLQLDNDSTYTMDIAFDAPSNEFKNILSLVPAIYKTDFEKLKTSGTAAFKGFVKGTYSPVQLPAYKVDLQIKDGFFQYPDLPQPVKNVQVTAQLSNVDGTLDNTVVDITKGHVEMGAEPFDFKLLFKNPMTTKYIDAVVKGKLNLAEITKFVKLDAGTKLSGLLSADAFAKGNLSALEQHTGPFSAGGFFDLQNLFYSAAAFPQPIKNGNFKIQIENTGGIADATTINVSSGHVNIGNDPLDFTLRVGRPVSAIDFSGTAKGRFTLDNIKQFTTLEPGTSIKGLLDADVTFSGSKADVDTKQYENIHTAGTVNLTNIRYASKAYPDGMQMQTAQFAFTPQNVVLKTLDANFQKTHFTASGELKNMIPYALRNEELGGVLNVTADKMNLNDWMGTDTAATTTAGTTSAPFPVPANINLLINAKAGLVKYDKVDYKNVRGALVLKDETVRLQNVQTDALDGTIAFDGSYSTKENKAKPDISFSYTIKDIDVQKAFLAYNTVQKLMPVGKFLSGKISSQFSMVGKLKGDMFPDLSSLTGGGNLLLIQGVLNQFEPLNKLATTLNVSELKSINLKDLKSHFEFANGKVLVKPFDVKIKDIVMQIGGMHGFDQSMEYIIGMKLPRRYLGTAGNNLINNLSAQATAKGIPVALTDVVDLNVKMGGTITNPIIKTDLKQAAGDATKELKLQATAFVQQKIDSTKKTIKDSLQVVKKQVIADVKTEIGKQIFGKDSTNKNSSIEGTKQKATETISNTLGGFFKKKKAKDTTVNH